MQKLWLVLAVVTALLVGGIAYASIPGPDGVIHGCYKNSNPAQGALIAIDSGASCPSGYTTLNWNQTGLQGPQGSPGLSGVHVVSATVADSPQDLNCPTGETALSGANGPSTTFHTTGIPIVDGAGKPTGYRFTSDTGGLSLYVTCAVTS